MHTSLFALSGFLVGTIIGGALGVVYVAWTIRKSNRAVNRGARSLFKLWTDSTTVHQGVYTNWKGETRVRNFKPHYLHFGSSEWHKEPQWLIEATDYPTNKPRTFALSGFISYDDTQRMNP